MKKEDVPQEDGINKGMKEIAYAVDENGRYVQVPSLGWEPKNIANDQAWEVITEEIISEIKLIRAGKRSPLAYHMAKNLMNISLLASYIRMPRWQVKRHLKPVVFKRLKPEILERYADVFGISTFELHEVPEISEPARFYKD